MHKLTALFMLIAAGPIASSVPAVAQILRTAPLFGPLTAGMPGFDHGVFLVGGMGGGMMGSAVVGGGMTGGADGGMTGGMGGGMTGGMGGGMTGGGMTGGMGGGVTGMPGGLPGYADLPIYGGVTGDNGGGQSYGTNRTSPTSTRSRKIYHCVTANGRCTVDSTFGAPRKGASCGCLLGGPGKIQ
jgi:hypothetical protein